MEDFERLKEFLKEQNFFIDDSITQIIEKTLESSRKAFLLRGPAGVGKTQLATLVSQYLNAKLIFFQCSYGTSEDDLLYKYTPSEESKSGIKITYGPIPRALKLSQTQKTILLVDEFDKTRPSADALLLDVLQNFRVSLFINDDECIVEGNPENLTIFLTSNDMREFSEPLLRRLIVLNLKPLPSNKIFELLAKRFKKETALLLTQIYDDTLKAGLRKPATIQELHQLGEIIESGINIPFEELIRALIIKYDDDFQKYLQYVSTREPYRFYQQKQENQSASISAYYQPQSPQYELSEEEEEKESESIQQIVQQLSRIAVKKVEKQIEKVEEIKEETIVTAKLEDHDFDKYTAIIKTLQPAPGDDPTVLGKFRVIMEGTKMYITAKEALTFGEIKKLFEKSVNGEYYVEDELILNYHAIKQLIAACSKVRYYTKNIILMESGEDRVLIEVIKREGTLFIAKIKMYVKDFTAINKLLSVFEENILAIANGIRNASDSVKAHEVLSLIKLLQLRYNADLKYNYNFFIYENEFGVGYKLREKISEVLQREPATTEDVIKALEVIVNEGK